MAQGAIKTKKSSSGGAGKKRWVESALFDYFSLLFGSVGGEKMAIPFQFAFFSSFD